MKHIFSLKKSISLLSVAFACLPFTSGVAQQMTAFERVGTDDESVQEFFPGEHRARPVLGAYTNSGYMGLFSGGQDLGGDRKSTRLNSSHSGESRMPSSA